METLATTPKSLSSLAVWRSVAEVMNAGNLPTGLLPGCGRSLIAASFTGRRLYRYMGDDVL